MSIEKEILTQLTAIQKQGNDIRLINVYKGFPISFPAKIKSVSSEAVMLSVHRYQTVCIRYSRDTNIKSPYLKQIIKAAVSYLDFDHNLAVARDFSYSSASIGDRELIRVEPNSTIFVYISNNIISKGELINISTYGLGLFLDISSFTPRSFGVGQKVDLSFEIFPNQNLNIKGIVKNVIFEDNNYRYRLGIYTNPDAAAALALSRYIAQRQQQILREIKSEAK